MPAKAGIQNYLKTLGSGLRGNDVKGRFKTFYETILIGIFFKRLSAFLSQKILYINKVNNNNISLCQ